jgi:hypothetical protein
MMSKQSVPVILLKHFIGGILMSRSSKQGGKWGKRSEDVFHQQIIHEKEEKKEEDDHNTAKLCVFVLCLPCAFLLFSLCVFSTSYETFGGIDQSHHQARPR